MKSICYKELFTKRTFKLSYLNNNNNSFSFECFTNHCETYKNKKGELLNTFNSTNMLILTDKFKNPIEFIIPNGYIKKVYNSSYTHTPVCVCGYFNEKNENGHDVYNFMYEIYNLIEDLLPKNEELTKSILTHVKVKNPQKGYRYFLTYPSNNNNKYKDLVCSDCNYNLHISIVLIKSKGFYIPFFILNDLK